MDDRANTNNTVVAGVSEQLHDGRLHPYPSGDCYCRHSGQVDSGAPSVVIGAEGRGLAWRQTTRRLECLHGDAIPSFNRTLLDARGEVSRNRSNTAKPRRPAFVGAELDEPLR